LPHLSKVRCCRPKKFGRLPEGLPHHHPSLAPTLPKQHYPLLCTITLASLVKGRWIDGKAQTFALLHFACDTSTFLIYQTFCRQDGGIAQQPFAPHNLPNTHYPTLSTTFLPPLSKVRCCRLKKFGRLPEGLHNNPSLRITFQTRTIPLAFRRVSVCVCLVGFASLQSPWAHTLKASLPCSLLPLHLILPSPTTIAKGQQPLSPHQHSCLLMNALLVLHPHYPLLCTTTLASLVKGRWIDGKAQTVALLHFACDTSTFLIYQTFCRQDGGIACYKLFQPCRHLR